MEPTPHSESPIGRVVRAASLTEYWARVYQPREQPLVPAIADYAYGRFVTIEVEEPADQPLGRIVGLIYNLRDLNQDGEFGGPARTGGDPRDVALPAYMDADPTILEIAGVGWCGTDDGYRQGVPPCIPPFQAEVRAMPMTEVRRFHQSDAGGLVCGYILPCLQSGPPLLTRLMPQHIDWLRRTFPEHQEALDVVYNMVAWNSVPGVNR